MNIYSLRHIVADDKATARITLAGAELTASAADLDWLLAALGQIRAELEPAVPHNVWGSGTRMFDLHVMYIHDLDEDTRNPCEQGALITARSPYFGWQQYTLSPGDCRGLLAWLQGQREGLESVNGRTAAH